MCVCSLPVIIRTLDPPLHEFLPDHKQALENVHHLRLEHQEKTPQFAAAKHTLETVERMTEHNPMIGFRGCRVGVLYPEIIAMQATAIFEVSAPFH